MYDVLPELYREVAARIIEQVGRRGYYNGSFDMEWEDMLGLFTLAVVYLNGKGSDAKRKIDAGINLTVFILFWVIFRIILSFVL